MPDELDDEHGEHGDHGDAAIASLHRVIGSDEWNHLSGTGAAARSRSRRMRRTRYAATAGSAVAVTGVAVLVASAFGGGGSAAASSAAGLKHHSPAAPTVPAVPHNAVTTTSPTSPTSPPKTIPPQQTMGSVYYDKWKTCPVADLTVGQNPPGVTVPSTSTRVWVDACQRMVATLSALNPGADVSPAPQGWQVPDSHIPPSGTLSRDEPVPAGATPYMGPSMYRIEDANGTVELSFHSGSGDGKPAGGVAVTMVDGLHAWFSDGTQGTSGAPGLREFYVTDAGGQRDAYTLLMGAPSTFTNADFKALVTNPKFEQMMAENLAEPNF